MKTHPKVVGRRDASILNWLCTHTCHMYRRYSVTIQPTFC